MLLTLSKKGANKSFHCLLILVYCAYVNITMSVVSKKSEIKAKKSKHKLFIQTCTTKEKGALDKHV